MRAQSATNHALVRATAEPQFLSEVCRVCVEVAGYRQAWIGMAKSDEAKRVRPVASAGFEDGYLDKVAITWSDTERGRGVLHESLVVIEIPRDFGLS
jgi:hypothetical protein